MRNNLSGLIKQVLPFAVFVGLGVLLFTHPSAFHYVVGTVVSLGALLGLAIMAIVLWVTRAPEAAARYGFKMVVQPSLGFVGSEGVGSRLRIRDREGVIRVAWGGIGIVIPVVMAACLVPAVMATWQGNHAPSLPVLALIGFLTALLIAGAVWAYLGGASMEVTRSGITLRRGARIERTIRQAEIDGLRIEPHTYVSHDDGSRSEHPNFILTAHLRDGTDVRLAITDRRQQLDELIATMQQRMYLGPDRELGPAS